ncbi:protein hunchback-like [Pogonomyrmex barbatus]|uniref:Protein hunchback-like n=1 Tax=Pogonomyrmex barbatus TaxID=144034 RepID=A0A6I9VUT3_9HYME|nr:protein hunchback-like [Pogonomyrmex barbatus]
MNECQTDRSLSVMSNIVPLSSEDVNPDRNILQYPSSIFATSNVNIRSEFAEHPIDRCSPKRNDFNFEAVLALLPTLESSLNQNGDNCFSSTLTEYVEHETEKTDDSNIRVPRVNPYGHLRKRDGNFREAKNCKQCDFTASTKTEYWEHMRRHIKGFTCSECSFVTKYKHHMNHHWLSVHDGSKPFKCKKCLYTCVSKSMLTSHLKKHSNIYPYRCADCTYKTKFCNALKKHLRKKEHQPAMVLNADGSPNPLSIIDVYGTKRGPKQKTFVKKELRKELRDTIATNNDNKLDNSAITSQLLSLHSPIARYFTVTAINEINDRHWINHNAMNKIQSVATFPYSDLVAAFNLSNHISLRENATFYENVQKTDHVQFDTLMRYAKILNIENKTPETFAQNLPITHFDTADNISKFRVFEDAKFISESSSFKTLKSQLDVQKIEFTDAPLDLRMAGVIEKKQLPLHALTSTNSLRVTGTSKRKGKAIKLERRMIEENPNEKPDRNGSRLSEICLPPDGSSSFCEINKKVENTKDEIVADLFDTEFTCHYCEIIFGNIIMYTVHMSCHSFDDPYTCNMCGYQCTDKLSFFLHIARSEH